MPAQPPAADRPAEHPAARNSTASQAADAQSAELDRLRADFPLFWIWRENTGSGVRYIARSQRAGVNPHTVVTADPAELRVALGHPDRHVDRGPAI
jgi:hypothetical protein